MTGSVESIARTPTTKGQKIKVTGAVAIIVIAPTIRAVVTTTIHS